MVDLINQPPNGLLETRDIFLSNDGYERLQNRADIFWMRIPKNVFFGISESILPDVYVIINVI